MRKWSEVERMTDGLETDSGFPLESPASRRTREGYPLECPQVGRATILVRRPESIYSGGEGECELDTTTIPTDPYVHCLVAVKIHAHERFESFFTTRRIRHESKGARKMMMGGCRENRNTLRIRKRGNNENTSSSRCTDSEGSRFIAMTSNTG